MSKPRLKPTKDIQYLQKIRAAMGFGERCARNPKADESWCPRRYDVEERSTWLAAFRQARRRG